MLRRLKGESVGDRQPPGCTEALPVSLVPQAQRPGRGVCPMQTLPLPACHQAGTAELLKLPLPHRRQSSIPCRNWLPWRGSQRHCTLLRGPCLPAWDWLPWHGIRLFTGPQPNIGSSPWQNPTCSHSPGPLQGRLFPIIPSGPADGSLCLDLLQAKERLPPSPQHPACL